MLTYVYSTCVATSVYGLARLPPPAMAVAAMAQMAVAIENFIVMMEGFFFVV
jgi:hypothetical protein